VKIFFAPPLLLLFPFVRSVWAINGEGVTTTLSSSPLSECRGGVLMSPSFSPPSLGNTEEEASGPERTCFPFVARGEEAAMNSPLPPPPPPPFAWRNSTLSNPPDPPPPFFLFGRTGGNNEGDVLVFCPFLSWSSEADEECRNPSA